MKKNPDTIAIVGAGVAGGWLAFLLAEKGKEVLLFDHKAPWEKPCGGGLTSKVIWDFPKVMKLHLDRREHRRIKLVFPSGRTSNLSLPYPMFTVSRKRMGEKMIELAVSEGADFREEKVRDLSREDGKIIINTDEGEYHADMVVGADGVNSLVRKTFLEKFEREDLCLTYGALLDQEVDFPVIMKFFKGVKGYAWVFPRSRSTSVGIAMEGEAASPDDLREKLQEFTVEQWERKGLDPPDLGGAKGWYIPALSRESFEVAEVSGDGWALVGDASGAADPLTGEGIYYALETATHLSTAVFSEHSDVSEMYDELWHGMQKLSIGKVARVTKKFYRPSTLRLLGIFLDYSPSIRELARHLVSGTQSYFTLKERVYQNLLKYILEAGRNMITRTKGERGKKKRKTRR